MTAKKFRNRSSSEPVVPANLRNRFSNENHLHANCRPIILVCESIPTQKFGTMVRPNAATIPSAIIGIYDGTIDNPPANLLANGKLLLLLTRRIRPEMRRT